MDAFPIVFAQACIKLREAKKKGEGVTLTAVDVAVLIEAMQILKKGPDD